MKKIKVKNRIHQNGLNPEHFDRGQLKIYLYMVPICIIMALPIVFIFMNAFKPIDELFAYPPRMYVKNPTFQNFIDLFNLTQQTNIPMSRYLINSIVSTTVTVVLTIYLSACTGYVLSKKRFRMRNILFKISQICFICANCLGVKIFPDTAML